MRRRRDGGIDSRQGAPTGSDRKPTGVNRDVNTIEKNDDGDQKLPAFPRKSPPAASAPGAPLWPQNMSDRTLTRTEDRKRGPYFCNKCRQPMVTYTKYGKRIPHDCPYEPKFLKRYQRRRRNSSRTNLPGSDQKPPPIKGDGCSAETSISTEMRYGQESSGGAAKTEHVKREGEDGSTLQKADIEESSIEHQVGNFVSSITMHNVKHSFPNFCLVHTYTPGSFSWTLSSFDSVFLSLG